MKNKCLLLASALLTSLGSMAQGYDFSVTNNTYQELVGATSLTNGQVWDDPNLTIPIGFNFNYFNTTETTLYLTDNFGLGASLEFQTGNPNVVRVFGGTDEDVIDRGYDAGVSQSDISYKLEGSAPNRILKIQWKNVGFYGDYSDDGVCQDFANFQVWMYETTHTIEYHYGTWSISQPQLCMNSGTGPAVFLFDTYDGPANAITGLYELWGNSANPTINSDGSQFYMGSLTDIPATGTVYRFSKSTGGVSELTQVKSVKAFPNPATKEFSLDLEVESLELIDLNGKRWAPAKTNGVYSINGIPAGVYLIEAHSQDGVYREKLIVQ